jgi:lysosomal alpha-glucosidase
LKNPKKNNNLGALNYNVLVSDIGKQFAIEITRTNGDMLFNTTNRPFIFEDQYLALTTALTDKHEPNIYGLGERVDAFRLDPRNNTYTMWNQDNGNTVKKNLYGQHPFYLEQRNDGNAHGFFFLSSNALDVVMKWNAAEKSLQVRSIGGIMDFFVFIGPQPQDVVRQYHNLIGLPHLIPYWALGFHQCRWGYKSVAETKNVVQKYKQFNLPLDTMWNDIDYMNGFRDFTFDPINFPTEQVQQFVKDLHTNGQHYIVIVDPGIKVDDNYPSYKALLDSGAYIRRPDGKTPIKNKVWPGITIFPDFTHPQAATYWKQQITQWLAQVPIDGLWIDMNELATFCDGECDKDNKYDPINPPYLPAGLKLDKQQLTMTAVMNASIWYNAHALYGFLEGKATREALMAAYPNKRPIVISRSTFAGTGRYNSHWLGDNYSTFESMYYSIPGMLAYNMFGVPFVGADICGFSGNSNAELCARWMQLGSFYPFSRNHNEIGTISQEPYAFNDTVTAISRAALENRYSLLPYYYTLFYRAHVTGDTVARPLFFEFSKDIATYPIDRQFLIGPALLVSPVLEQGATMVKAYIPADNWYCLYHGKKLNQTGWITMEAPFDHINAHVRGGFIIPRQQPALNTAAQKSLPYNLIIAANSQGAASGELYMDDGESLDAVSTQKYSLIQYTMQYNATNKIYSVRNNFATRGFDVSKSNMDRIEFYGLEALPCKATLNGKDVTISTQHKKVIVAIGLTLDTNINLTLYLQC